MRNGELLDPAFARLAPQIARRDRAWLQELVYGTFRLRGRIDLLLSQFLHRPLDRLEDDVLDILRLGSYQLLEMHSVPAYAAISQSVQMTKSVSGRGATGLVNGVLQSLRRAEGNLGPADASDAIVFLTTWGSHPRWLVERWLRRFGRSGTEALIEANNRRPETYLRPFGMSADQAIALLRADEVEADSVKEMTHAVRLGTGDVARALELVPALVQDPAAMLVVQFAEFNQELVADLCTAPGGKALAAVAGSEGPGFVLAADISSGRLERVRENAQRVGARNIAFVVADARRPPLRSVPQALLDVPCTGTGTLRRHPDGKWRLGAEDLVSLVALQREILDAVAPIIKPDGLLVYSTCSLEPEENEQQIERFLHDHEEFALEAPHGIDARWLDGPFLRVLPQEHGFDGAFAARLRRAA